MSQSVESTVADVCRKYSGNKTRMMDIVRDIQSELGYVSGQAMEQIAQECNTHRVEVESVVTFYAFLNREKKGDVVIRVCNDVPDVLAGAEDVAAAFESALEITMGETTADGKITLEWTPCIGMSDQAPAIMVNDEIVTNVTPGKAGEIAAQLKGGATPKSLVIEYGDGNNASDLVQSMVNNNIVRKGAVVLSDYDYGTGLKNSIAMGPEGVIQTIKDSNLRGRGGAGFPTGLKLGFTRDAAGDKKTVMCNADEGEPGTFKDRVLLTEYAQAMYEGMAISAYAIGADTGIVYLRAEYAYLTAFLEDELVKARAASVLGQGICGSDFNFDIRIQMGAGAYVCGEETALISSCEGLRGDPKTKPPFPAQKGYLGTPTAVNNVETFCCMTKIMEKGADWFRSIGTTASSGTKVLSISGDCARPGLYEFDYGTTMRYILSVCGAESPKAVQVAGACGVMINASDFNKELDTVSEHTRYSVYDLDRRLCFGDLATGGSLMIFNEDRDVIDIAKRFMEFFVEESCGYCTPCRVGNTLILECLENILKGRGRKEDLTYLEELGQTTIAASRCGLGQTSPNPVLSTIKNFRADYEALITESKGAILPSFDIHAAIASGEALANRKTNVFS